MVLLDLANFFAKYSCPKWNRSCFLRKVCRTGYQKLSQIWIQRREARLRRPVRHRPPRKLTSAAIEVMPEDRHNTYPWPYRDERFADWVADDSLQGCSLVSDPSGFAIRHSASYCAWKIREATGRWPMQHSNSQQRFDAKNWEEFLKLNHGRRIVAGSDMSFITGLYAYVGILPQQGEHGRVVWLESIYVRLREGVKHFDYLVSTYENRRYRLTEQEAAEIIWMEIPRRH